MESLSPDERDVLERISEKAELQPFFFRKVKGLKWFDALMERGFLSPDKNPQPVPAKEEGYVSVPFWPAAEYLVSTSEELKDPLNAIYAGKFLALLRDVTDYARQRQFSNYRTWWQFSKTIQNISPELIADKDMRMVDYWLDDPYETTLVGVQLGQGWAVELLRRDDAHSNQLAETLLQSLYRIVVRPGRSNSPRLVRFRVDDYHVKQITAKVAGAAGAVLGRPAVLLFQNNLEFLLRETKNSKWSSLLRPAIEEHKQNYRIDETVNVIIDGLRDSLLMYEDKKHVEAFDYIDGLLSNDFSILKRIAIYAINERYSRLQELVGKLLNSRYFTGEFRHELWHLLRSHYSEFGNLQKSQVRRIIAQQIIKDEAGKIRQEASAYSRAIWCSAIKDAGQREKALYQKYILKAGTEPEHPDFSSYMTTGWVDHKSPIPFEELVSSDLDELVKRLATIDDSRRFGEADFEGLAKSLRQAVKSRPLRFYGHLSKFLDGDLALANELIEAYNELWSEKAKIPWDDVWESLLKFCHELIAQPRFWSPDSAKPRRSFVANRYWIVGAIGRLIENGTKSDDHAFNAKLLPAAETVLQVVLRKEKGEGFKIGSDAVSVAINSPRGRCIEAFINLTLRACRLSHKKRKGHRKVWSHFEQTYQRELDRTHLKELEFVTLLSMYLPNFLYMDKKWVLSNLGKIFDKDDYNAWLCAMQGYAHVGIVYPEIYAYLRDNGHFVRALEDENIKERVQEKIIQNIAIAYFNEFESFEDERSLINRLLGRRVDAEMSHLVWFVWTLRDSKNPKLTRKVFELWRRIVGGIELGTKEQRKFASRLCSWAAFVDQISDENRELILAVAGYAEEDYNSHQLLEAIARLSLHQPTEAYDIWVRLLENAKPDFPEEAIRTALTNLSRKGPEGRRQAKNIADQYIRGGNGQPAQWLAEITGAEQAM